jgi:hypothetical protein
MITDNLTGYTYHGNRKITDLLNGLCDKNDELAELLYPFQLLMKKYEIDSVAKLDHMLMEQRVW